MPEAAELLSLSRSSTYDAVQRGDIPSIRVGSRILIPLGALEDLINGRHDGTFADAEATPEKAAESDQIIGGTAHG